MEKQNVIYPPKYFVEGMRVKLKGSNKELGVARKWFLSVGGMAMIQVENPLGIKYYAYNRLEPIVPKLSFTPDILKALLEGRKTQTTNPNDAKGNNGQW